MQRLQKIIENVHNTDQDVGPMAQTHLDNLTKPQGSLGRLEDLARRLAVIRGSADLGQPNPAVAVFAADHGVALAGVSPYPREVTAQMVMNFLAGGAGINVLSRRIGADVVVVDVGVDYQFEDLPGLISAKIAPGTANMLEGPAMTREQAIEAILVGVKTADLLIDRGADLLVPGEMGIGNTTPSAALAACLTGLTLEEVTGRGAGLDDDGLQNKIDLLKKILDLHKPDPQDPVGLLAAVGGLEIAAITGYVLGGAARGVPVMLDGFICTAGATLATRLAPAVRDYLFAGHASVEIGQRALLKELGLDPILNLNLRLGEGTGGALAVSVLSAAVSIYNEMATFESAGVSNK